MADTNVAAQHHALLGGIIQALRGIVTAVPAAAAVNGALTRLEANHTAIGEAIIAAGAAATGDYSAAAVEGVKAASDFLSPTPVAGAAPRDDLTIPPMPQQDHSGDEPAPAV